MLCHTVIMLSVVFARPEPHFGRHRHHGELPNDSDQFQGSNNNNDRSPFGHHPFPRIRWDHNQEFGPPSHGTGHGHGFGCDFGLDRAHHHHHHGPGFGHGHGHRHGHGHGHGHEHEHGYGPEYGPGNGYGPGYGHEHESNSNYDNFNFNFGFNPNRHNPPFGFSSHIYNDYDGFVGPQSNGSPFPFSPGLQWPIPFVPPPLNPFNTIPNGFNPFATNWPMNNANGINVNEQMPQAPVTPQTSQTQTQPPINGIDSNAFATTTTLPVLDPTSIVDSDNTDDENDTNSNNSNRNETTSHNTINSNTNINDGNGDAGNTVGWPNTNEFFDRIPHETNSNNNNNGIDQLGGGENGGRGDGDAVANSENPNFIATTTMVPIPSVTSNIDQVVTATTPHNVQTNTDYYGLIDVRFGDDANNNTAT